MDTTTETTGTEDATQVEAPKPTPPADAPQQAPATQAKGDDLPDDPEKLKEIIRNTRAEAGKSRVNAKAKAAEEARESLVQELGKALGLIQDDTSTSPEELTRQLTAEREAAAQARLEVAVYKAANGAADPARLLDSMSFRAALQGVDPADADAVQNAVKTFVEANPHFTSKPAQVAGPSTVPHAAGSGEGQITKEQFDRMSGEERNQLYLTNVDLYRQLAGM